MLLKFMLRTNTQQHHERGLVKTTVNINPLSTKVYLSDLKTQFVPRSKHSLLRF